MRNGLFRPAPRFQRPLFNDLGEAAHAEVCDRTTVARSQTGHSARSQTGHSARSQTGHSARSQTGHSHPGLSRGYRIWLLAFCIWLVTACHNASLTPPAPVTLRISGSTSMTAALDDLAQTYEASHPNVLVDVRGGGSAIGLEEVKNGAADVAAVSWQAAGQTPPTCAHALPVARDAIAIVVNPHNPAPGLTLLQIRAIYRGETLDWAAVGGPAEEPLIISREDGSGTRQAFEALVMGNDRVTLNALVMPGSQAVVDYVAGHRAALGYVSQAALTDAVRVVPIEGMTPTAANVRTGAYHLIRPLYLCAPEPVPVATQGFLDFALSPAGQTVIARHHVPLR